MLLCFPSTRTTPSGRWVIAASRSFGFSGWPTSGKFSIGTAGPTFLPSTTLSPASLISLRAASPTTSTTKPKRARARRGGWPPPPDDGSHSIHVSREFDHVQEDHHQSQRREGNEER